MQVVVDTRGTIVKKRNNCFYLVAGEERRMISPHRVSSIMITSDIVISTAALQLAASHEVPVFLLDKYGSVFGKLWSPYFGTRANIRRQQIRFLDSLAASQWIVGIFQLKTAHQVQNLTYLMDRKPAKTAVIQSGLDRMAEMQKKLAKLETEVTSANRSQLMGTEGIISKSYWNAVSSVMPDTFAFQKRSRRPALDCFNAGLNYAYGMTYSWIERAVTTMGLDPYTGVLHADQYKRPGFVFDMIEPFRPWIDRWWIDMCLYGPARSTWFREATGGGVFLNKQGKRVFIPRYHKHLETRRAFQGQTTSVRDHFYGFAQRTASEILNFAP